MRSLRLILALLADRISRALQPMEIKRVLPQEFLEMILREMPDRLTLHVVGPSMIANFSYFGASGDGTTCSTSWYPQDGVMPAIYRALLHEGANNDGVILDPYKILAANHGALREYLGERNVLAAVSARVHGKSVEYPEA